MLCKPLCHGVLVGFLHFWVFGADSLFNFIDIFQQFFFYSQYTECKSPQGQFVWKNKPNYCIWLEMTQLEKSLRVIPTTNPIKLTKGFKGGTEVIVILRWGIWCSYYCTILFQKVLLHRSLFRYLHPRLCHSLFASLGWCLSLKEQLSYCLFAIAYMW